MRKIAPLLILLPGLCGSIVGQTQPSNAEKKVYQAQDEKLYINKDLGVYLWISTSPDPDSEKIRLTSESSVRYTNPMYFDTEGYNTVRSPSCVDPATKQVVYPLKDIIFEVFSDGLPPKTSSRFAYGSTRTLDGKKYYSGDLSITLKSHDEVSGTEALNYALNTDSYSIYKSPLNNAKEGENTLRFYSIDNVGNQEDVKEETFYLDNTPPETYYEIKGEQNENFVSAKSKISLTGKDNLSGVKSIYYKINKGPFKVYTAPIPASLLITDNASISYYAVDMLGNKEAVKTIGSSQDPSAEKNDPDDVVYEFYVDNEPPDVAIEIEAIGDVYQGKYHYVSPRTTFKITASDEKSGVKEIRYDINSSKGSNVYTAPFVLKNEGLQYIHAIAEDYVGNSSSQVIKPFVNDTKPPQSSITIGTPKFSSRDTLFITSETTISLKTLDDNSGVKKIQYTIGDKAPVNYDKPFSLPEEGIQTIAFSASDQVNNIEPMQHKTVFIDNQPPKIHYHFSVESIGSKRVRDENYTIYPTNAMVYIAATDARVGGEKIEYTINDGAIQTANPIKNLSPGNYEIKVFAYDVLGNKSSETLKFAIEE